MTERPTGRVGPPSIGTSRLHCTFKQLSEMLHVPVTGSLDVSLLVRVLTEAHMSLRSFGGKVMVGVEDGVRVGVEAGVRVRVGDRVRAVGKGVAVGEHMHGVFIQKSLTLAFAQIILDDFI